MPIKLRVEALPDVADEEDDLPLFKIRTAEHSGESFKIRTPGVKSLKLAKRTPGFFKLKKPELPTKLPTPHFDVMDIADLDDDQCYAYYWYNPSSGYQLRVRRGYQLKSKEGRAACCFQGHIAPSDTWFTQTCGLKPEWHRREQRAEKTSPNGNMRNVTVMFKTRDKAGAKIPMFASVQALSPRYEEQLRANGLLDKYMNA